MLIVTCAGDKIKAANIECKTVCPTSRIDTLNCHDAGAYLVASHTAGMVYPPCAAAAELRLEGWTSDPKPPLPPTIVEQKELRVVADTRPVLTTE